EKSSHGAKKSNVCGTEEEHAGARFPSRISCRGMSADIPMYIGIPPAPSSRESSRGKGLPREWVRDYLSVPSVSSVSRDLRGMIMPSLFTAVHADLRYAEMF